MKSLKAFIKRKTSPSFLSWDSSFAEKRITHHKRIQENSHLHTQFLKTQELNRLISGKVKLNRHETAYSVIHDQQHLRSELPAEDEEKIYHFCGTSSTHAKGIYSSKNLNYFLRNKAAGDDLHHSDKQRGFIQGTDIDSPIRTEQDVERAIHDISQIFTEKHTNKTSISVFGGVPEHIGQRLIHEKGTHYLAGFTSTSTNFRIALAFAREYEQKDEGDIFVVHYYLEPHTGVSVAKYSPFSEDEVLLKYGTKITFDSVKQQNQQLSSFERNNYPDLKLWVIHVHASNVNESRQLSDYGRYHHPSYNFM